ncbi:Peptidase A1 domain-containing protein [Aphelenchoides besseyi]|nr:Peptidase A1 domain-containing protein [Aphelenchoides besseyi]
MLFSIVLVSLAILPFSHAYSINWPFSTGQMAVCLNLTIGTPPQQIPAFIDSNSDYNSLEVLTTKKHGLFNPNESHTFVKTGIAYDDDNNRIGIYGKDVMNINGVKLKSKSFIVNDYKTMYQQLHYGVLGLARSNTDTPSFIESVLNGLDERFIVFSFDEINLHDLSVNGLLTLGGYPTARCSQSFLSFPEEPYYNGQQWGMKIDELQIGKYVYDQPGVAIIAFNSPEISVPASYYSTVKKVFNVGYGNVVSCDLDIEIVFTIGGMDFKIRADDYLQKDKDSDTCTLLISQTGTDTGFILPLTILRDQCWILDYDQLTIGFTDRVL